jgi:hypothetical protein
MLQIVLKLKKTLQIFKQNSIKTVKRNVILKYELHFVFGKVNKYVQEFERTVKFNEEKIHFSHKLLKLSLENLLRKRKGACSYFFFKS